MGVLVEELLLLARLDEIAEAPHSELDLVALAADAVHDARATAPDRAIALEADAAAGVRGDAHQLRQVLGNLLRNALVHTPAGTPVEVTATAGDGAGLEPALGVAEPGAQRGPQDPVVGARDQLALGPADHPRAVCQPRADREIAVAGEQRRDEREQRPQVGRQVDALLVLCCTAAVWAVVRAFEDGRTRWIVLAGVCSSAWASRPRWRPRCSSCPRSRPPGCGSRRAAASPPSASCWRAAPR